MELDGSELVLELWGPPVEMTSRVPLARLTKTKVMQYLAPLSMALDSLQYRAVNPTKTVQQQLRDLWKKISKGEHDNNAPAKNICNPEE